eukprot:502031-Hanusia_phi.AAC.1
MEHDVPQAMRSGRLSRERSPGLAMIIEALDDGEVDLLHDGPHDLVVELGERLLSRAPWTRRPACEGWILPSELLPCEHHAAAGDEAYKRQPPASQS